MLAGSFAFATMSALAHALGRYCAWQVIVLARTSLQLLFATALAVAAGVPLLVRPPWTLWVRSLAGSAAMVGTFFALTQLPVSEVLTLSNMFPLWVAVLSWPILHQPPSGWVWLSVASGLVGVGLIQQPHGAEASLALSVALASSVFTALAMIALHRLRGIDARAIVVHFSVVALLCCLACFGLFDWMPTSSAVLSGPPLAMLLALGAAATVGQICLTRAYASGPAAQVSVVGLTQIVFGLLLDVLLFHRTLDPLTLLGIILVVVPTGFLMAQRVP
jgi:drug/metabolite transporter (DMT)-like permease